MKQFNLKSINPITLEEKTEKIFTSDEFQIFFEEQHRNSQYQKFWNLFKSVFQEMSPFATYYAVQRTKSDKLKYNFMDIKVSDGGLISYMPGDKEQKQDEYGNWLNEGRQTIKIGRFLTQFFNPILLERHGINDQALEGITAILKGRMSLDDFEIKIIDGEEIRQAYSERNHLDDSSIRGGGASSSISGSCMRYEKCQPWFDLYVKEDKIKMLVMIHKKSGKIAARALLWDGVLFYKDHNMSRKPEEFKFMDRVYAWREWMIECLYDWATTNGYIRKFKQSADNKTQIVKLDGSVVNGAMYTTVEGLYSHYPYLDTFTYLKSDKKTFVNSEDSKHGIKYKLTSYQDGNEAVNRVVKVITCTDCGAEHDQSSNFRIINGGHVCNSCVSNNYILSERNDSYIPRATAVYDDLDDQWIEDDDAVSCVDYSGLHIMTHYDNAIEANGRWYRDGHPNLVSLHDGEMTTVDNAFRCAETDEFYRLGDVTHISINAEYVSNDHLDVYMDRMDLTFNANGEIVDAEDAVTPDTADQL